MFQIYFIIIIIVLFSVCFHSEKQMKDLSQIRMIKTKSFFFFFFLAVQSISFLAYIAKINKSSQNMD